MFSGQRQNAKHFECELPNGEVVRSGAVGLVARDRKQIYAVFYLVRFGVLEIAQALVNS